MKKIIVSFVALLAISVFASSAFAASNMDQPSFYKAGEMSIGAAFSPGTYSGFGVNGEYFFTNNISGKVVGDFLNGSYNYGAGSFNINGAFYSGIIEYHMALSDMFGVYGGAGIGFGSITGSGGGISYTVTAAGFVYDAGVEAVFNKNFVVHAGLMGLNGIDIGLAYKF